MFAEGSINEILEAAGITDIPIAYIKAYIKQGEERMTGIECLKAEMKARGCTTAQINSKVVCTVLDIISNSGDKYTKAWQDELIIERQIDVAKGRLRRATNELERTKYETEALKKKWDEMRTYAEKFNDALAAGETPEARDTMRRAQMFVNSVDVNSKYDNTAYIIGLAAILSDGKCGAIDELKKINPKLFANKE